MSPAKRPPRPVRPTRTTEHSARQGAKAAPNASAEAARESAQSRVVAKPRSGAHPRLPVNPERVGDKKAKNSQIPKPWRALGNRRKKKKTPVGAHAPSRTRPSEGPIVDARERFTSRVRRKPWQQGRHWLTITVGTIAALVVLALLALAFLPQLKVSEVRVAGATYVDASALEQIGSAREGQALAFADLDSLEKDLAAVPGVKGAKASRHWPSTIRVVVTERTAIANLDSGGHSVLVDGSGTALPSSAANPADLPHLVVDPASANTKATEAALLEIVSVLPPNLRAALTKATASAPSNVTLEVSTKAGPRTVVWGGPEDSELKAKVLEALLSQPGAVIDVSSPEAPTIR